MIELPKTHKRITDNLIVYVDEFKGKPYVNIRKTYTDKDSGQEAVGKGLTLSFDQWEKLTGAMDPVVAYVEEQR